MTGTAVPAGFTLRLAGAGDMATIDEFVRRHAMRASMRMRFDRGPDYFGLLDAHSPCHETWLLFEGRALKAMGSIVLRPGYLDGEAVPVAYLGDLRVSLDRRIAGRWRGVLGDRMRRLRRERGVGHGYCCIIRDNRRASSAVLGRRRGPRSAFSHLRGYANVSLLARKPWRSRPVEGVEVRRATRCDAERVRVFLDREAREQPFGVVFDERTWRRRLGAWPDFGIERFYLAEDPSRALLGCLAPWDPSPLNRIVIERADATTRVVIRAYNLLAPAMGRPHVVADGSGSLADVRLTHLQVRGRSPEILAALLDRSYEDLAATRRYATVSLCLYDADPLWPAIRGYWHHAVPMDLYAFRTDPDDTPVSAAGTVIPGFEIYLV